MGTSNIGDEGRERREEGRKICIKRTDQEKWRFREKEQKASFVLSQRGKRKEIRPLWVKVC